MMNITLDNLISLQAYPDRSVELQIRIDGDDERDTYAISVRLDEDVIRQIEGVLSKV